eukprot:6029978-Pyramimonas_sp.AAC.1
MMLLTASASRSFGGASFCAMLSAQATSEGVPPGLGERRRTGPHPAIRYPPVAIKEPTRVAGHVLECLSELAALDLKLDLSGGTCAHRYEASPSGCPWP